MAGMDRLQCCNAIKALFEADTSVLYGSTKLINYITTDIVKFENAKLGVDQPYKMFLKAPRREKVDVRMSGNVDYNIYVEYRIEGLKANPQTSYTNIDDIDERIEHLCDNEMWEGNNLSSYFTNAEVTIINIEWEGSNADVKKDEGGWKVESEGTIRVEINRVKTV